MDLLNLEPGCYEIDAYSYSIDDNNHCHNTHDIIQVDDNYQVHLLHPQDNELEDDIVAFKRDENGNFYLHCESKDNGLESLDLYYIISFNNRLLFAGTDTNGAELRLEMKKSECRV